jgi:hypothetical protein
LIIEGLSPFTLKGEAIVEDAEDDILVVDHGRMVCFAITWHGLLIHFIGCFL